MKNLALRVLNVLVLLAPLAAQAGTVPYFWTGKSSNPSLTSANNWQDELVPDLTGGTSLLMFTQSARGDVFLPSATSIDGLHSDIGLFFSGSTTLTLGSAGLSFNPSTPDARLAFGESLTIALAQDQLWSIATGTVELRGGLSGTGNLTMSGDGTLQVGAQFGSYNGTLTLTSGTLEIAKPSFASIFNPLGSGTVVLGSTSNTIVPTLRVRSEGGNDFGVSLSNDFVLHDTISLELYTDTTLAGGIALAGNTTLVANSSQLEISSGVTESTPGSSLTVTNRGRLILTGANAYTGGTQAIDSVIIFGSVDAVPTTGYLAMNSTGYIGLASPTTGLAGGASAANAVSAFLARFDPVNAVGTIGFDSDPNGFAQVFDDPIDLTGLHSDVRLGSHTKATLGANAIITPAGTDYRFGGGGGLLAVDSALTGARGLVIDSPTEAPLTVALTNAANNFSGGVTLSHSGLILTQNSSGSYASLPTGSITMDAGSYFGLANPAATFGDLLSKFTPPNVEAPPGTQGTTASLVTTPGILGLDLDPAATASRYVDLTNVDLSVLTQAYLGTSSRLVVDGEVAGPGLILAGQISAGADGVHRFAAYKGGALAVSGELTGNSLVIGHPDSLGAFGDAVNEEYSTVLISGSNNALAGGTTLYSGRLLLGQNNGDVGDVPTTALGSGALTVEPVSFTLGDDDLSPLLASAEANLIFSNPIVINSRALNVGGDNTFYLTGNISGLGALRVGDDSATGFTAVLSGNNTYQGGTYVSAPGRVISHSDAALGTGALFFEGREFGSNPTVEFTTLAPIVHGLSASNYGVIKLTTGNQTLTIDQPLELDADPVFRGAIESGGSTAWDPALLVKTGSGMLRLEGNANDFSNSYGLFTQGLSVTTPIGTRNVIIEVRQGALAISNDFELADTSSTIWVNGGTLGLANNNTLLNPILATSGVVGGFGYLSVVTLGTNGTLSPGTQLANNRIGALSVEHVTFGQDSIYEWDIAHPDDFSQRDHLSIFTPSTLEITATPTNPFVIRPVTLDSSGYFGVLGGIDANTAYSWELIAYQSITGITQQTNPSNVILDLSNWQSTVPGTFDLHFSSLSGAGVLSLNFTPVPEPSTYALLALGLGLVAWQIRRRRG